MITMSSSGRLSSSALANPAGLEPSKYHFVLVHGFMSGAWCWYKVRTLLEASGFKVTCLDFKACGVDPSPVDTVHSFDDYTGSLNRFLANYTPDCQEKMILVGHSAGGLSVTDATYKFSSKIHVAVYVAATMLKHGFATEQDVIDGMPQKFKSESELEPDDDEDQNLSTTEGTQDDHFDHQMIHYHTPQEEVILNSMLSRPGPLKAIVGARFPGTDDVDCVPRVYIKTLQDKVLTPQQQESMIRRWPPARVLALNSDHGPNVSSPFLLSGMLVKAIDECLI